MCSFYFIDLDLGSIYGAIDALEFQSITRNKYLENGILPDWFIGEQTS